MCRILLQSEKNRTVFTQLSKSIQNLIMLTMKSNWQIIQPECSAMASCRLFGQFSRLTGPESSADKRARYELKLPNRRRC